MTNSPPTTGARWPFKLAALALALIFALAAAEIFIRLAYHDEVDTVALNEAEKNFSHMEGLCRPSLDAEIRYELKPGRFQGWGTEVAVTTSVDPVRISTLHPPPPNPAFRIALIGDSTSFGQAVFYDSSYPAILRSELEHTYGMPIELRNYSLPAYNAIQERAAFEQRVLPWKPDLLLLHYDHNDTSSNTYDRLAPDLGDNRLHSALIKFTLRRLRLLRWNLEYFAHERRLRNAPRADGLYISGGAPFDRHLEEHHRIGEGVRALGIPAVAVIYDWNLTPHDDPQTDPHFTGLHKPLVDQLEHAGFLVLDLYPAYQEVMRRNGWADLSEFSLGTADRAHPNEAGHAFIAEHLHGFIINEPRLHRLLEEASRQSTEKSSPEQYRFLTDYRTALRALDEGRYPESERLLRKIRAQRPDDIEVKLNLARILVLTAQADESLALFREVLQVIPDFAAVHLFVSDILLHYGRFEEALENHLVHAAAFQAPGPVRKIAADRIGKAATELAWNHREKGDPAAAVTLLEQVILALEAVELPGPIPPLRELAREISRDPQATAK